MRHPEYELPERLEEDRWLYDECPVCGESGIAQHIEYYDRCERCEAEDRWEVSY